VAADSSENSSDLEIRRASVDDLEAILALARRSLGWTGNDDERFFRWKHFENPVGPSPMWVALADNGVIGFRTFMRWQFARDGMPIHAVRAVDTATDPEFQGRGIFSRLTLHGLEELHAEGVPLVFNTPNSKSLPGYLKMGWHVAGRLPVRVMLTSPRSLWQLAGARTSASRDVLQCSVGERPEDVFAETSAVARLLNRLPVHHKVATTLTPQYLRWRYGLASLNYRVVMHSSSAEDGLAVFHLRRRGRAVEGTICDVLVPVEAAGAEARLMTKIASLTDVDYLLRIDRRRVLRGFVPIPRIGPVLAFRSINGDTTPRMDELSLSMGDVELF